MYDKIYFKYVYRSILMLNQFVPKYSNEHNCDAESQYGGVAARSQKLARLSHPAWVAVATVAPHQVNARAVIVADIRKLWKIHNNTGTLLTSVYLRAHCLQ